jgi:transposase
MRHPPIHEEVAALKERLPHAHNGHKKPRLQRLSLLASGQAHTRQDVAPLLGVHRHTLGRWLALYAAGGLDVLLATSVPAGKPVSLAPAVLASLAQGLRRPEGFASYAAWRHWVRRTYGVEAQDKTLYMLVRSRFEAKRNVARRSHTKKSRRHRRLSGTLSSLPAAGDPVCRYAPRPRLHPRRKPRQLTDRSPLAPHRPRCAACWAGAAWLRVVLCLWAVALTTGERFFLELS